MAGPLALESILAAHNARSIYKDISVEADNYGRVSAGRTTRNNDTELTVQLLP